MGEPAKIIRTRKEWTETCAHCKGSGRVHTQESFALWTPDEYEHVQPLDPKHDVPPDAYVVTTAPGASIFDACKEGVDLARMVSRPVAFEFNGAVAVCRAASDPETVAKAWWLRAYGKTYEQSMRDR